jgi:hypothetical protein
MSPMLFDKCIHHTHFMARYNYYSPNGGLCIVIVSFHILKILFSNIQNNNQFTLYLAV